MKTETSFIRKGSVALLSGALVLAFSPVAFAPAAYADEAGANIVIATVDKYMTSGTSSTITGEAAESVIAAMNNNSVQLSELPQEYQVYVLRCQLYAANNDLDEANKELETTRSENEKLQKQVKSLQTQLSEAQGQISSSEANAIKTKTKITKLNADASSMGKVVVSWKVSNSIDGLKYQIKYKAGSGKATTATSKVTKKTFTSLAGGSTYVFQVRAYKKISGKNVYGKWSKKASAKVIASYAKGTYKVKGDWLNVHEKTSTTSDNSDVLVAVPKGTKVKVTAIKVVDGTVWGKLTYKGQTGWVHMQYLTKA